MHRSNRMRRTALRHHIAGAALAATTLGGNAQFELDFVKAHTRPGVAHVLRLLRDELEVAMALTGCKTLADAPAALSAD